MLIDHGRDLIVRPLRTIRLTSCGGAFLCRHAWVNGTWSWNILKYGVADRGFGMPDWCVLCLDLEDPAARKLCGHTGQHPEIIKGVVMNLKFVDIVRELKEACQRSVGDCVNIALVCTKGRHRNVAIVELMGPIIERV